MTKEIKYKFEYHSIHKDSDCRMSIICFFENQMTPCYTKFSNIYRDRKLT